MKITYLGHASLSLEIGGKKLIVDPFITPNEAAKGKVDVDKLEADYILISHAHGDHIADVEAIAKRTKATIIAGYEVATHYGEAGYDVHPINHGGKFTFDFGTLKFVNALHSSVFPDGKYGGNSGGFVIWSGNECVYIAADTALTMDMKLIPMTCPKLTVAILPVGDNFTMGYEDAAIASDFVECDTVIGYHYDTFPPIKIDKKAAQKYFKDKGKELLFPEIGASLTY